MSRFPLLALVTLLASSASCVWFGDPETDSGNDCISAAAFGGAATPEPNLDPTQVGVAGSALAFAATRMAWAYEPPALGWDSASCVTISGADADTVGFPDVEATGNVALDACTRDAYGNTFTFDGSSTIDDLDDGATTSFAHAAVGSAILVAFAGLNGTSDATWTQDGSTAGDLFVLESSGSRNLVDGVPGPNDVLSEQHDWTVRYDPASAWTPGTPLVAGSFELSRHWFVHFPGVVADGGIEWSTVTIDASCPSRIVAGSIVFTYATRDDDVPNPDCGSGTVPSFALWELTVSWDGCDSISSSQLFLGIVDEDPWDF